MTTVQGVGEASGYALDLANLTQGGTKEVAY
jgi:hypothetical protein